MQTSHFKLWLVLPGGEWKHGLWKVSYLIMNCALCNPVNKNVVMQVYFNMNQTRRFRIKPSSLYTFYVDAAVGCCCHFYIYSFYKCIFFFVFLAPTLCSGWATPSWISQPRWTRTFWTSELPTWTWSHMLRQWRETNSYGHCLARLLYRYYLFSKLLFHTKIQFQLELNCASYFIYCVCRHSWHSIWSSPLFYHQVVGLVHVCMHAL